MVNCFEYPVDNANGLVQQLRGEAEAALQRLACAISDRRWGDAITAQIESLFWRAAALSVRLGVARAPLLGDGGLECRLVNLEANCLSKLVGAGDDPASRNLSKKIESVVRALNALRTLLAAFDRFNGAEEGPATLALAGGDVGRADILLTMAEAGHWEHVARLEAQHDRRFGGSSARRPAWEQQFEKVAVQIACGKPVRRADMIRAAQKWDQEYRRTHEKGLGLPATDKGIGDGIDRIAATGAIILKHELAELPQDRRPTVHLVTSTLRL
jgi:hypothetical protein